MTKLITTKEELDKALPNIKIEADKPIVECGSEDACELKEQLLSSKPEVPSAEQIFNISYECCNKEKILEHYSFDILLERIIRTAQSGEFEIEVEDKAYMLNYKPFKKLLEDKGYKVYLYRGNKRNQRDNSLKAHISWGHEY